MNIKILDDILHIKLEGILSSQLVQENRETLKLRIITNKDFTIESLPKIKKEMETLIGTNMKYEFELVEQLETNKEGKIPFIISHLDKHERIVK